MTALVDAALLALARELHKPASLDEVCEQLGASRDVVVRAFVRENGVPPYARQPAAAQGGSTTD